MKVFLSHSSADKDIVGKVYEELGAGICHYDVATFNPTGFLPEEIFNALSESTHFVLFASATALQSEWVQGELRTSFINWSRQKIQKVMVFLLRDGKRELVPEWLQNYVITEHPSPKHIALRILAEYDSMIESPPFYRHSELMELESKVAVERASMPAVTLVCGIDGMGRKMLINELFDRRFRRIPRRKIYLQLENYESDIDFYKFLLGAISLVTMRELSKKIQEYTSMNEEERLIVLTNTIVKTCAGFQTIILETDDSVYTDDGLLVPWLVGLVENIKQHDYPVLNVIASRRPRYVAASVSAKIATSYLAPLPEAESRLLFDWCLKEKNIVLTDWAQEYILEQVTGNLKLMGLAVSIMENNRDVSESKASIDKYVLPDLEQSSSRLLLSVANSELSKLLLAFVVDCGHIGYPELLSVICKVSSKAESDVANAITELDYYGFLDKGSLSLKVPGYLSRAARSFGEEDSVASLLRLCRLQLDNQLRLIDLDVETSVTILDEACIASLKTGQNSIIGIDSVILPSQCLKVAVQYYHQKNYQLSYDLSKRAFVNRLALTVDAAVETLRYQGMSAARLNNSAYLEETLKCFGEFSGSRAKRICEFIRGFNYRLDGGYDSALRHMEFAFNNKGEDDIHVLRELSFLYLWTGQAEKAKTFIARAVNKFKNNSYLIELQVLIELAHDKGYVYKNQNYIDSLIRILDTVSTKHDYAKRARVEYALARDHLDDAKYNLSLILNGGHPVKILQAKIFIYEKRFSNAVSILQEVYDAILSSSGTQRRTLLPQVSILIVEAASGISVSEGILSLKDKRRFLPERIKNEFKKELREQAAYSRYQLSIGERETLGVIS